MSDDHIREVTLKNASGYINAPYKLRTTMALAKAFGQMLTLIKCANLYDFQGQDALGGTETPSGPQLARTHAEWDNYEAHHRARMAIRPGITGLWQVSGRNDITDFEDVINLDLEYINNWSLGGDIRILLATVRAVLKSKGAK